MRISNRILTYILLFLPSIFCLNETKLVEEYITLIEEGEQAALKYKLATNNDHFYANKTSDNIKYYGKYDFIVVGAGSAGGVIASRLSEVAEWNILLIEAGKDETNLTDIPGKVFNSLFSKYNWGYFSKEELTCCQGMVDHKCVYWRGKVVGGSSTINGLFYTRGNRMDYEKWKSLGNTGWSYEDVLPYFKKSENSHIHGDDGYHGIGGPWDVSHPEPPYKLYQNFKNGYLALGYNETDYNGKNQFGVSRLQTNIKKGKRASIGRAFIDRAKCRQNLELLLNSYVTEIMINNQSKIAQGVKFMRNGVKYYALVRNEVIISAGAVNSPQLLMLSGIGPQKELRRLKIPVIQDLPVGKNLKDHATFFGIILDTNYTEPNSTLPEQIKEYLKGRGTLTRPNNVEGIAFFNPDNVTLPYPLLESFFAPPVAMNDLLPTSFNFNKTISDSFKASNYNSAMLLSIILLHPKSTGSITLSSNNARDFPIIDLSFFSYVEDLEVMYSGIQHLKKLIETPAFKSINATLKGMPICQHYEPNSKDFWFCMIRSRSISMFHPHGTTRMGPRGNNSVVNSELKIHGFENLRVADCGVIPVTISGHLNAVGVMIGEKTSDIIKKTYNKIESTCD